MSDVFEECEVLRKSFRSFGVCYTSETMQEWQRGHHAQLNIIIGLNNTYMNIAVLF